ncbi:ribonucleotide-diphosphate reductase subunit beta [Marinococcus halophilus]|uniref:Ribonucleoside-diphosphate reductase subunit beta n=1 Tax=Marinococcus halophilus TaxID=1371 RepID=A0A510Y1G6_MARHA|nr:ribonucleotide-diphosphate reductase subunit beta [Marinococcus halophilus]OZT81214.1 ribonucleotide-diphosphate reductase subunit beta [Marinococcus halophilus]GEK57148.1 ribonucleoside-diphosphate reductase subunit beta [Marinococcus halophilus]
MALRKIKLLEPQNPNHSTGIVNGEASGIVNWNDIPYPQFYDIYKNLRSNFWIPDEISMAKDIKSWGELGDDEQEAFKRIIGLLSILDSVQTNLIQRASGYVTDPSVHAILAEISSQEAVHNQSYSYVLSSIVPLEEQNRIFDMARNDPEVMKRNQLILDIYDEFDENPTPKTLAKALVGSIILEGINFYSGFAFFYNLARQQKMVGTSTMISYIQKDEMQHGHFVAMLLRALLAERPDIDADGSFTEYVYETIDKAVQLEIRWSHEVLTGLEGIDLEEMDGYIKYIANKRLRQLGLDDLYEGYTDNVMPWIRTYSDEAMNDTKTDFFEQKSREYAKVSEDNGFDDL